MRSDFCTYVHLRPDGRPFYVGKGTIRRALWKKRRHNPYHRRVVAKYGLKNIRIRILKRNLTEEQAFAHEREAIACLRDFDYRLCNLTDGGDGASGWKPPPETLARMRAAQKGRKGMPHTEETKRRLSELAKAREHPLHTQEAKDKIRAAHVGRKFSDEHKDKLRQYALNRPPSHNENMAASKRGLKFTPERLEVHRECHRGLLHTPETKAKMSAAKSAYWARRKAEGK